MTSIWVPTPLHRSQIPRSVPGFVNKANKRYPITKEFIVSKKKPRGKVGFFMLMFVVPVVGEVFISVFFFLCGGGGGGDEQVPNEWSRWKERLLNFLKQTEISFALQNWIKPSKPSLSKKHPSESIKIIQNPSTPCLFKEFVTIVSSTSFTFSHLHPSTC